MVNQILQKKFDIMLTTIFGVGYLKPAPGTYGSLMAAIFIFAPSNFQLYLITILLIITFISIGSINRMEIVFGNDPSIVVIDEFLAMGFIYLSGLLPNDNFTNLLAFLFFRVFDIFKPFPINLLNNKKGAVFVLADDFLAGLYTVILIKLLIFINNLFEILNFFK